MSLSDSGPIIACPVTINYLELILNFIENLKKFSLEKNIYLLCLDDEIYEKLKNIVFCKKKTDITKKIKNRGDWIEAEKYSKFALFFDIFSEYKRDILLCDVDVIFLKNPLPLFYRYAKNYEIISSSDKPYFSFHMARKKDHIVTCVPFPVDYGITDQKKYGFMNGAVALYVYSDELYKKMRNIFTDDLLKKYPKRKESGAAQTIYNVEIRNAQVKVKVISVFDIANGSLLNVDYLKKKVMEKATGIHYNFCNPDPYIGYNEKIRKIKQDGFWYL